MIVLNELWFFILCHVLISTFSKLSKNMQKRNLFFCILLFHFCLSSTRFAAFCSKYLYEYLQIGREFVFVCSLVMRRN